LQLEKVQQNPQLVPILITQPTYSVTYISIVEASRWFGVIVLKHQQPLNISQLDLLTLQSQQLGQILEQSQTYHQLLNTQVNHASGNNASIQGKQKSPALSIWQNRYEAAGWASGQILYEWNFIHNRPTWGANTEQLLGYCPDEMPTSFDQWRALIHPDDREMFQRLVQSCIEQRCPMRTEYRIQHAQGHYQWVEDRNHVFVDANSYSLCVVGFIIDIDERKRRDEELKETHSRLCHAYDHLERAVRQKDEFLACMSHELRTPLNSILCLAEMLLEEIHGALNIQQIRSIQRVSQSAEHLLALINDILDVEKIEAGVLQITPQPILINDLCESSLEYIRNDAQKKSIHLEFQPVTTTLTLKLDQRRIRQVLINLLSNAVKFTPDQGRISLKVELDQQHCVRVTVSDTGIGIQSAHLTRLFQPFQQIDSALSRQQDGSGLGLFLSQRLVHLHGGEIQVSSKYGQGSCFTIVLPQSLVQDHTPTRSIAHPPDLPNQSVPQTRILLAEDNPMNVEIFSTYLSNFGYEVVVAEDGETAFQLAQQIIPDVMLVDIQLPKCNGLDLIPKLRQQPELSTCPIIALTALAMPADRQRCLDAGANHYLAKPVKLKELLSCIQDLLIGH
jgi:PAS domain S-box-containing protein